MSGWRGRKGLAGTELPPPPCSLTTPVGADRPVVWPTSFFASTFTRIRLPTSAAATGCVLPVSPVAVQELRVAVQFCHLNEYEIGWSPFQLPVVAVSVSPTPA